MELFYLQQAIIAQRRYEFFILSANEPSIWQKTCESHADVSRVYTETYDYGPMRLIFFLQPQNIWCEK